MIYAQQLEIPFESQVQVALTAPEATSIRALWAVLEPTLSGLPDDVQLQIGARAIAQLVALIESKADYLLNDWEYSYTLRSQDGPVLSSDLLAGVLRQSMDLDLTETVQIYTPPARQPIPYRQPIQSVVQEMDKADLLHLLEQETQTYTEAIAVAHEEDALGWIEAIAHYLTTHLDGMGDCIQLLELQQALDRPLIEVWLGLLLGEMAHLEQVASDFYSREGLYVMPNVSPA